jgi:hypothetical protein
VCVCVCVCVCVFVCEMLSFFSVWAPGRKTQEVQTLESTSSFFPPRFLFTVQGVRILGAKHKRSAEVEFLSTSALLLYEALSYHCMKP